MRAAPRAAARRRPGTARAGCRGRRRRAASRRRRRSRRRAARPARAAAAASPWVSDSGSRERESCVFTRVSGRRRSRRAAGRRDPRRVRACAVPPDQADAAAQRGREVVGVALERQAELEQLFRRGVRPATPRPATSPAAIVAAREPSPRSSGIRLTKRKRWPLIGATSANARSARCSVVGGTSSAPSPSTRPAAPRRPARRAARSRGRARRRRSRSRARGWPSSAGARTTTVHVTALTSGEDRLDVRLHDDRRARSARRPRPCPSGRGR